MRTKKTASKKLKTIIVLSAITICSSIGISSIKSNAWSFKNLFNISIPNPLKNLKMPEVELVNPFRNFRNLFSSKSKLSTGSKNAGKTTSANNPRVNKPLPPLPTEDEPRTKRPLPPLPTEGDPRTNRPLPPLPTENEPRTNRPLPSLPTEGSPQNTTVSSQGDKKGPGGTIYTELAGVSTTTRRNPNRSGIGTSDSSDDDLNYAELNFTN